ncbi:hypothetical protein PTKIN_Ptkin02bG0242800 [Pterospermum kingtungense]
MAVVFSKTLTKTDVEKRLSVPSAKKQCFLEFRGQHKKEFKVVDTRGKVWAFGCSIRKKKQYPKPVLSKGWLQFVRWWGLQIDDEVKLHRMQDKAGKGQYVIEAIKRASQRSSVDKTMAEGGYSNVEEETTITSHITEQASHSNIEDEPTLTSQSTDNSVTYDRSEGLHDHLVAERVGLKFEFAGLTPWVKAREPEFIKFACLKPQVKAREPCLKPQVKAREPCLKPQVKAREPEFIDFLALGSQERREKEQPSFLTLHHREPKFINFLELGSQEPTEKEHPSFLTLHHSVESPNSSSTAPYFNFL